MKDMSWLKRGARQAGSEHGATLPEFAIVLIVFFTLLFGIMQGGLIFGSWIVVTNAAREGARFGSVCISRAELPSSLGPDRYCDEGDWTSKAAAEDSVKQHTTDAIAWPNTSDSTYDWSITATYDDEGDPRLVSVAISYSMPNILPVGDVLVAGGSFPLKAKSEMRIEE